MEYKFDEDEVMLCKGDATLDDVKKCEVEILLTNKFLNLKITKKKLFKANEVTFEKYSIDDIKTFKEKPQVILSKDNSVEIYFMEIVVKLNFAKKKEAKEFVGKLVKELTGKTKFERGVDKVKGAIAIVDKSLGVSSTTMVKTFVGGIASGRAAGAINNFSNTLKIAKSLFGGKKKKVDAIECLDNKIMIDKKVD